MERAVRDGYDVRGLMYWTLVDNFEVRRCAVIPDPLFLGNRRVVPRA